MIDDSDECARCGNAACRGVKLQIVCAEDCGRPALPLDDEGRELLREAAGLLEEISGQTLGGYRRALRMSERIAAYLSRERSRVSSLQEFDARYLPELAAENEALPPKEPT